MMLRFETISKKRWLAEVLSCLAIASSLGLVAVVYAVHLVRAPQFLSTVTDPYIETEDYVMTLNGANCDILIYGDSTAKTAFDPGIVQQGTGLKTCNIAQTKAMVAMSGTAAVDLYLKHNRRPRFMVFQLAPETLYRDSNWEIEDGRPYMIWLLRHGSGWKAFWVLWQHPHQSASFLRSVLLERTPYYHHKVEEFHRQYDASLDAFWRNGVLTLPDAPLTKCTLQDPEIPFPPDFSWMQQVRSRYSVGGTRVLINLSPIPPCDPHVQKWRSVFMPVVDRNFNVYPIGLFNNFDRHTTTEGKRRASLALVAQLDQIIIGPTSANRRR